MNTNSSKNKWRSLQYFGFVVFVVAVLMQAFETLAQEKSLIKNGDKILFVGNSNVGSEGGLNNHFRQVVERTRPHLEIEADWIGMYDKPTLSDMYPDQLVDETLNIIRRLFLKLINFCSHLDI